MGVGKLEAPADLRGAVDASGFSPLGIKLEHALTAGALPRRHDDPFDRMLIAQAQHEGLALVTCDRQISEYALATFPAS